MTWEDLKFWDSGEHQVIQERLDDFTKAGISFNPKKENIYAALDAVDYSDVKVMIVGQDPYPLSLHATGIAFSIPKGEKIPPTLDNILKEYTTDTHYPRPESGDLTAWCKEGVLLWNAIPTCETGKPLSHQWPEWDLLTREIITFLSEKGIVFVLLGGVARSYANLITPDNNRVIETSHPSPRGNLNSRTPFLGSRLFTTINAKLKEIALPPVNWRL